MRRAVAFVLLVISLESSAADTNHNFRPDGFGPILIGMDIEEASRSLGVDLHFELQGEGVAAYECFLATAELRAGLSVSVWAEHGKVIGVIGGPGSVTESGIRIGSSRSEVSQLYGSSAEYQGPFYDSGGGDYIIWASSRESAMKIGLDDSGAVNRLESGNRRFVLSVEGPCM